MISFRYHLVSIVAVLFALAIGIVVGSGLLSDPLRRQLKLQVDRLAATNEQLLRDLGERDSALDQLRAFAEAAEGRITEDALLGRDVVLLSLDGTDGAMLDGLRASIEQAGGRVALTVTALDRLALEGAEDRSELATLTGSAATTPGNLRRETASILGSGAAAAAAANATGGVGATPDQRFEELAQGLADAGFLALDDLEEGDPVPTDSLFLVAAGAPEPLAYGPAGFVKAFCLGVSDGGEVVVAEPAGSAWGLVEEIRADADTTERVSTVDQADTVPGRIETVLGLDAASEGRTGHYGVEPGATLLPEPAPGG